jgi:hypothetical protein
MFIMTDLGGVGCPIKFPPVPILNRKKLARYDPALRTPLGDAEARQIAAYANGLVQLALSKPSWLDSRTMQLHYTFSLYTASLQRFYDEASKAKFRDFDRIYQRIGPVPTEASQMFNESFVLWCESQRFANEQLGSALSIPKRSELWPV